MIVSNPLIKTIRTRKLLLKKTIVALISSGISLLDSVRLWLRRLLKLNKSVMTSQDRGTLSRRSISVTVLSKKEKPEWSKITKRRLSLT